jgi:hypothetical protein
MTTPTTPPVPPDPLEETRAFWRETAREMVRHSFAALDEAAKQIIAVAGILEGLYFHAIAYSGLRGTLSGGALWVYAAPMLLLLVSLAAALAVYFPERYTLNVNSSQAGKLVYERVLAGKLLALRIAAFSLLLGVGFILWTVLLYLQG